MKATINVSLRIPDDQARVIQKAAKREAVPLATFIRRAALYVAQQDAAFMSREAK